jgi:serine/threonine protein kinase
MPLAAGTRLGAYEIVSLLGSGGMGEVYRARDPKLQREIALKVLSDFAASDPDRRERFTREALAVAALNHPHIVTIHSVEEAGPTVFLTMELVEGRPLAEVMSPGGLPLDQVVTIGIAVAEAMSAAHRKGITHRDLKPGNIMLGAGDQTGRIKVLDFGLAKIVEAPLGPTMASTQPTEAPAPGAQATAEGRILGTVAYMSPEQAEGKATDGRSDLFSLGVVLYEMATGQRPFAGETSLSILSSILKDTPRSVTDVNPTLPRDLGRIIRRALAKDPDRRYQSAKDLRNDLEDLKASLDAGEVAIPASTTASSTSTAAVVPSDANVAISLVRKHSWGLASVAALVLGAAAAVLYLLPRHDAQPSSNQAATLPTLVDTQVTQLTSSGTAERPAISPDGRYVAYVQHESDTYSLWIRQTATTSTAQIVPHEPGVTLFGATFTPDATSVDYVRQAAGEPAEVWRVPFLGGASRRLIADVASPISWSPDGRRMAFLRAQITPTILNQLIVSDADGGQERTLARDATPEIWISLVAPWLPSFAPAWSPDGRLIAVAAATFPSGGYVVFVDSQTGSAQRVQLVSSLTNGLTWLDAQSLVLNQAAQIGAPNQMFRVAYPSGTVSRLTNDPNDYIGANVTGDRRDLITGRRDARMDVWVGDGKGVAGTTVAQRVPVSIERLAWSGNRLLYAGVVGGRPAVLRLTPGDNRSEEVLLDAVSPAATADGRMVFIAASQDNFLELWSADPNGRRIAKLAPEVTAAQVVVTPDDRFVLYTTLAGGTAAIWMVPIEGGTPTKLADGSGAAVSPDGGSIAFVTQPRGGGGSIVACKLADCRSPQTIAAAEFRDQPLDWTPDSSGVAFARAGNVWVQSLAGGPPRQLTRFDDNRLIRSIAWSKDGTRLAVARSTVTNDIVLFRGVK